MDALARRQWKDLRDLDAAIERAVCDVERPAVRSTLPEEVVYQCIVDYIGAYAYWDIPTTKLVDGSSIEAVESSITGDNSDPSVP